MREVGRIQSLFRVYSSEAGSQAVVPESPTYTSNPKVGTPSCSGEMREATARIVDSPASGERQ